MFQQMLLKYSFLSAEIYALVLYLFPAALAHSAIMSTQRLGVLWFLILLPHLEEMLILKLKKVLNHLYQDEPLGTQQRPRLSHTFPRWCFITGRLCLASLGPRHSSLKMRSSSAALSNDIWKSEKHPKPTVGRGRVMCLWSWYIIV